MLPGMFLLRRPTTDSPMFLALHTYMRAGTVATQVLFLGKYPGHYLMCERDIDCKNSYTDPYTSLAHPFAPFKL